MPITPELLIPTMFLPQIAALRDAIESRVIPAYSRIEQEAEEITRMTRALLSERCDESTDWAALDEQAAEAGVAHSILMADTRQTILNLFAVAIHHLFAQQRHMLTINTLGDTLERKDATRERIFDETMTALGVDRANFAAKTEELRLVANTVKHADGDSAEALRFVRPDLFDHPLAPGGLPSPGLVHAPMMGDDLYVREADLYAYLDHVESYWRHVLSVARPGE